MIEAVFQNSYGKIIMGGAGHPLYRILTIDGLGMPDFDRNVVHYYNEPGQELIDRQINSRTITMSIDIVNRGHMAAVLSRWTKILSVPGNLVIRTPMRTRAIKAECISFTQSDRNEAYQKVVIQFICDNPYFKDERNTVKYLYTVENLLTSPFELPMAFSKRINKSVIHNSGDVKTEPVIHLFASDAMANDGATETVIIKNNTTGQQMTVIYAFDYNETLTVDVPERRLYSSTEPETALYCISDDTYLSDFYLIEGDNEIEVLINTSRYVSVTIEYNNNYREAVV